MQHEIVVCGVPFETEHEQDALRQLKDLGVTSVQIYTFWKDFEPSGRGQFDWRHYDREVELIQKAGLKYVPFILMGPKYAVPQWWLDDPKHVGLYCLEHHKYNPIESIWNLAFRDEISRVLQSFAAHYLPMNVLESIQPGICGDYGEAIMPVHGNWPGDYHTHRGYWCAGEDAQASFKAWLTRKYQNAKTLNAAWRSHFRALKEVTPFLPHQTPSRTALFDMLDWYNDSMTEYAEFWLRECRAAFPQTSVYLCTGGSEEPEHASSFSSQARVAGKHGCGIRLTNEGNKFYDNFFITAYTESACNLYGAYMGLEPVGPITDKGVVARIFGSADYGNRQMFHYFNNLFEKDVKPRPSTEGFKKYISMIQERSMPETVGFFWPGYYAALNGGMPENVDKALRFMRRMTACLPVNEEMILDGALARHKLLVMPLPGFTKREVLLKVAEWVHGGGVLLSMGMVKDLEMERVPEFDALFGILPTSEEAAGICTQHIKPHPDFPQFSKVGAYTISRSWLDLADDVQVLSEAKAGPAYSGTVTKATRGTFYRKVGDGLAIYYGGPLVMEEDPEAVFYDRGTLKALLHDVLVKYSRTTDLTPAADEVARTQIDNAFYALKDGEIVKL
jgi:hypothetical protein